MPIRRVLTILSLLLIAGAAIAGIVLYQQQLPDPERASPEQLVRWLVTRDLARESVDTRDKLARRLEDAFPEKLDWPSLKTRLDVRQRERLWNNIVILLKPWFLGQMERYFGKAPSQRTAFLDGLLDRLATWRGVESLCPDPPGASDSSLKPQGIVQILLERVEQWKRQVGSPQRERIASFVAAVQSRWVQRQISELF